MNDGGPMHESEAIPREVWIPDEIRSAEGQAWEEIHDAFEHGWIETIEEAEAKFQQWRTVQALGQQGLKHVW